MNKYEVAYIIRPTLVEEGRKALIEEMKNIFTSRESEITNVKEWGMRDLAYEIEKHRKGFYVIMNVTANNEAIDEFNRVSRIKEDIIRFMVISEQ